MSKVVIWRKKGHVAHRTCFEVYNEAVTTGLERDGCGNPLCRFGGGGYVGAATDEAELQRRIAELEGASRVFAIQRLDADGFWRTFQQSSIETGFTMGAHPTFSTRAAAAMHIAELQSTGTWRGLRVLSLSTREAR